VHLELLLSHIAAQYISKYIGHPIALKNRCAVGRPRRDEEGASVSFC
jgi:hypothetical protein